MRIAIIEDEPLAADKLKGYIAQYWPEAEIVAELCQVSQVLAFFAVPRQLELIFSDIELTDGQVFSAMQQLDLPCPVIFTTSYDNFWMQAFQSQGIEYLLKPFSYKRFCQAMTNYAQLSSAMTQVAGPQNDRQYKHRFIIKKPTGSEVLPVADISCFRAANGVILARDRRGEYHIIGESSITELEARLDPQQFFRLNRSEVLNLAYLQRFEPYAKDTLAVYISQLSEPMITSKTRSAGFRRWLEG
jgi:DNA-binding LytR/AlgR family response regulator